MSSPPELQLENTDRELWREREGDYYANSIHVTKQGGIGINVGGYVYVKPLEAWFELAGGKAPFLPALAAAPSNGAAQEHGRMPSASSSTGVGQTDDGALTSGPGMRARNAEGSPPVAAPPSADEVKRLTDDARRYRWLRDESEWEPFDSSWLVKIDIYGQYASDMDAAIDALCNPGEALREGGR